MLNDGLNPHSRPEFRWVPSVRSRFAAAGGRVPSAMSDIVTYDEVALSQLVVAREAVTPNGVA